MEEEDSKEEEETKGGMKKLFVLSEELPFLSLLEEGGKCKEESTLENPEFEVSEDPNVTFGSDLESTAKGWGFSCLRLSLRPPRRREEDR